MFQSARRRTGQEKMILVAVRWIRTRNLLPCRQALQPLSYGAICMTARFEKRAILMKSRNSILNRSLHSEFSAVIYVTEYRSKSLKKTARPLLSMTPHIYIRPETDYDLPTSCEPVKQPNQIWRLLSNYSKPARDSRNDVRTQ